MTYVTQYKTIGAEHTYSFNKPMNLCPTTGKPVTCELDVAAIKQHFPAMEWYHPEEPSMWRFGPLMALDRGASIDRQSIVSLGEGNTPILDYQDWPAAERAGVNLWLKDEAGSSPEGGCNPTGSFKDRGMSMVVSMAKHFGLTKLAIPTQGNAGDSLVTYGQEAHLEIAVVMPEDTPAPIIDKVATMADRKAKVHLEFVKGTIREAGERMKKHWLPQGFFNVATFQEPGWRIEGKKSLGLEIAEPNAMNGGQWQVPDAILYPTGGGTGILGMWKAFDELEQLGVIGSKRPRIYAIQSDQTQPVVAGFQQGRNEGVQVTPGHTIATGLNVPGGVGHFRVLEILRDSGGAALAVSEQAIREQLRSHFKQKQSWLSPEGAAVLAGFEVLLGQGSIRAKEKVVMVNTGAMEKYFNHPEAEFLDGDMS